MTDPTVWATLAGVVVTILAGFGIVGGIPDAVRTVLVAFGPVVGTWAIHETHKTRRNADNAAVEAAKVRAAAVQSSNPNGTPKVSAGPVAPPLTP